MRVWSEGPRVLTRAAWAIVYLLVIGGCAGGDAERERAKASTRHPDAEGVVMTGKLGVSSYSVIRTDHDNMVCGRVRVVPGNEANGAPADDSGPFCYSHADLASMRLELPWYRDFEGAGQVYLGITDEAIDRVEAGLLSGKRIRVDVHDQVFALVVNSSDELTDLEGFDGEVRVARCHCEDDSCVCG